MPCIRCGACVLACPADLQPHELYWFARSRNFGKAQEYYLFDCIECGCCAYVCPSRIPLVDYYRYAKSEIWAREREKADAESANARYEFRQFREEREKIEKAARLAKDVARQYSTPDRPRFVLGSVGPGTQLPSLGDIGFDELKNILSGSTRQKKRLQSP